MRTIEADEGSIDTHSACDVREAEMVLEEHRRDDRRIAPTETVVQLSRGWLRAAPLSMPLASQQPRFEETKRSCQILRDHDVREHNVVRCELEGK
jgi:hypothetical protein